MSILRSVPLFVDVKSGVQRGKREGMGMKVPPHPGSPPSGKGNYEPDEPGDRKQSGRSVCAQDNIFMSIIYISSL